MSTNGHIRHGSLQFYPRKRAVKLLPRIRWNSLSRTESGLLGFIGYKVGMKSAYVRDNGNTSLTKGQRIIIPVTILEFPSMKILSVRFYKDGKVIGDVLNNNLDKELKKKIKLPKEVKKKIEDFEGKYDDLRIIAYSQVKKTGIKKKPDIVILEGWCVGARPQKNKQLIKPVNLMEKNEDMSVKWRKYVNFQLKTKYKKLYSQLTSIIYLKTQSFNLLRSWRIKQERKLKTKKNINSKVMTNKEVKRFMMTYERITLQMFKDMPKISKVVLSLNKFHQINNIRFAS